MALEHDYHGQHYRLAGERQHIRRDGALTTLAIWRSHCATCGEPFEFLLPVKATKFMPSRRCRMHKKPGVRVQARPPAANVGPSASHQGQGGGSE